jgi:hypothetical protein
MRFVLIMLLLGTLGGGYKAYEARQKKQAAQDALRLAREQLAAAQSHLQTRQAELAKAQQVAVQLQAGPKEVEKLKVQRDGLVMRAMGFSTAVTNLREDVVKAVDAARAAALEKELPELQLTTGRTLRGVKIRSIEATQVSISHADGLATLPADQLPGELRSRLGLDGTPLLQELDKVIQTLSKMSAAAGGAAPTTASNAKKKLSPLKSGEQRVHDLILTAPVSFTSRSAGDLGADVFRSLSISSGKSSNGLEVSISKMVAKPGVQLDLDRAAQSAVDGVMRLPGMHRSSHAIKATTVAGLPAKQSTFSALRNNGAGGVGTVYMEGLYILQGDTAWSVQAIFTSETTGNRPLVEEMFRSIRFD